MRQGGEGRLRQKAGPTVRISLDGVNWSFVMTQVPVHGVFRVLAGLQTCRKVVKYKQRERLHRPFSSVGLIIL